MLQEITAQRVEGDDREHNMLETITTFLNLFKSGFTKKTIKCSVCHETKAERETAFQELLLKFDPSHHESNDSRNSCTLGEMLSNHFEQSGINTEQHCERCNSTTQSVERHWISGHPDILCLCLCRGTMDGKILSSVDFPVQNFIPNEILGINDGAEDAKYDLVASVNHHMKPNSSGHWTAICKEKVSGNWYEYNDERVTPVSFINKRIRGVMTVKKQYQRLAAILFYVKNRGLSLGSNSDSGENRDTSEHHNGDNSDEWSDQSNRSRFSQCDNIDHDTESRMQNDVSENGVGCISDQPTLNTVSIPVIRDGAYYTMCLF